MPRNEFEKINEKSMRGGESVDIAVLTAAASNDANSVSIQKIGSQSAADSFEEILCGLGKKFKQKGDLYQDINSILLQCLALITMSRYPNKQKCGEAVDVMCGGTNALKQTDVPLSDDAEISKLWKTLITNLTSEGKIDEVAVAKFYKALKLYFPELSENDFSLFLDKVRNQLNRALENINITKDGASESESKGLMQTNDSQGNVIQKESGIFHANKENALLKDDERLEKDIMLTKIRETWGSNDSSSNLKSTNPTNFELRTADAQKENSYALKNDFSELSGFLSEMTVEHRNEIFKSGITNEMTGLSDIKTLAAEAFKEIVDKIYVAAKDKTSELSLKLKPDFLGNVLIKLSSEGDKIRAEIFVENAYLHEVMQYHAQELKNHIQQQGYNLTELNVYQTENSFAGGFGGGSFRQNSGPYHFKKTKYSYNDHEKIEELIEKSKYDGWQKSGSINYVV